MFLTPCFPTCLLQLLLLTNYKFHLSIISFPPDSIQSTSPYLLHEPFPPPSPSDSHLLLLLALSHGPVVFLLVEDLLHLAVLQIVQLPHRILGPLNEVDENTGRTFPTHKIMLDREGEQGESELVSWVRRYLKRHRRREQLVKKLKTQSLFYSNVI